MSLPNGVTADNEGPPEVGAVPETDVPTLEEVMTRLVHMIRDRGSLSEGQEVRRLRPSDTSSVDQAIPALAWRFGLDGLSLRLLLTACAPGLNTRFGSLLALLQDNARLRWPSQELLADMWTDGHLAPVLTRLHPRGQLSGSGLLTRDETLAPPRVTWQGSPRLIGHLLEDGRRERSVGDAMIPSVAATGQLADDLKATFGAGLRLVYIRDHKRGFSTGWATQAMKNMGWGSLCLELPSVGELPKTSTHAELLSRALLEARLRGQGLILGPLDKVEEPRILVRLAALAEWPVVFYGHRPWDPSWLPHSPALFTAAKPNGQQRLSVWNNELTSAGLAMTQELESVVGTLRLAPHEIARGISLGKQTARTANRSATHADLLSGARQQDSARLESLAERRSPVATWDSLVLAPSPLRQLRSLRTRAHFADLVIDDWGVGGRSTARRGITALFAGDPGTGKSLAAEVVAGDLGLDLYKINLATIVDKYIGETEKNLDRLFEAAEGVNGILFFDEADALFGKRTEVKDSKDRYANVEVAYLLQRMESFEGVGILATNLRANLDEAFLRRIDIVVDFALPDSEHRLSLWELCLGRTLPRHPSVDLRHCAQIFELSGGEIRNACVEAAFRAAESGGLLTMEHLLQAAHMEYRKLGRLPIETGGEGG